MIIQAQSKFIQVFLFAFCGFLAPSKKVPKGFGHVNEVSSFFAIQSHG